MKKIISFLSLLGLPMIALAEGVSFPNPLGSATTNQAMLAKILGYMMWAGGIILTGLVVWAAFTLMFSKGDPAEIKKAKNTLLYGVIGYVILLFAGAVRAIIMNLLGANI